MIIYKVSIPENKQSFFQEFLDMIGVEYEKKEDSYTLTKEQKKILDQRLKEDKANFVSAREALNCLREKYEL